MLPLILSIIHSIFGIQFVMSMMSVLARPEELMSSTIATVIIIGAIPFIIGVGYAIRIEQVAGFYECQNCHHKYVPNYKKVLFALHIGRSRKMKCPKCGNVNYHKKVIN